LITYISAIVTLYWDITFILLYSAVGLFLFYNSKVPKIWLKALLTTWLGWAIGQMLMPSFLWMGEAAFFKRLPPEFTQQLIVEIAPAGTPIIGRLALTYGSLYYFVAQLIRWPMFLISGITLVYTVNPSDLVVFLRRMRVPSAIILILQAGLRFFTVAVMTLSNVWTSQSLRGMKLTTRNPVKLLRAVTPFLIPVGRQFVWTVDQVVISTSGRGFGSATEFEPYRELRRNWIDNLIIFTLPILLVIQIYFLVTPPYYFGNI
jgi:energy-coupling factor transporter transmembrane protein EcfT